MPFTRRLSRAQRYAISSVGAFGLHWSLACALPIGTQVDTESEPALVWLEAAPSAGGVLTGVSEQRVAIATTSPAPVASAVRPQVRRDRDVSRLARASASTKTVSSSTVAETLAPDDRLEVAVPAPKAHAAGAPTASATAQSETLGGSGGGVASGGAAGTPVSGASGDGALVHGPILRAAKGCAGYFPTHARAGHGEVEIDVTVDAGGHARESHVLNEQPFGQGFGVAARGCVRTLSFAPAVDRAGTAVSGHAKLRLRFDRPFTT